jgi:hypothetical protein
MMIKRIVKWSIYAALVGVLVFGAVNRTSAKLTQEPLAGQRSRTEGGGLSGGTGNGQGASGGSRGNNEGLQGQADLENRKGQPEHSAGAGLYPQAEARAHSWITLKGKVLSVSGDELQFSGDQPEVITIDGRSWQLALEQGFDPGVGDQIELKGFYENGEFETAEIHDLNSGQEAVLRDASGRPLWSGGGKK